MKFSLSLVLLGMMASFAWTTNAASYAPPRDWHGQTKGEAQGNPVEVNGQPLWAFCQVAGKDPQSADALKPMIWSGSQWIGPREFGGQPSVSIQRRTVKLASRGSWGGSGNTQGVKTAAIALIAPTEGQYKLTGNAQAEIWQGKGTAELIIYHRASDGSLTLVKSLDLEKDAEPVQIEHAIVELKAGEQLVVAALVARNHTAANVRVRSFQIMMQTP